MANARRKKNPFLSIFLRGANAALSSLSESTILRKNMSPTAISGFLCYPKRRNFETNLRFVRALCLSPTGC